MIPQWVPGAAARDAMRGVNRGSGSAGGGSPSGRGGFSGVLSFGGVLLMGAAGLSWATEMHLGGFPTFAIVVVSAWVSFWLAYRTLGWFGVVAGVGFPILSAFAARYTQVFFSEGVPVTSLGWPIAVLVVLGIDQTFYRIGKRQIR
jgi:hypothetical protein